MSGVVPSVSQESFSFIYLRTKSNWIIKQSSYTRNDYEWNIENRVKKYEFFVVQFIELHNFIEETWCILPKKLHFIINQGFSKFSASCFSDSAANMPASILPTWGQFAGGFAILKYGI